MSFQEEILPDLEKEFGTDIIIRRVAALSYDTTTGVKTENAANYVLPQCLVRRIKDRLDGTAKRSDLKVVIRKSVFQTRVGADTELALSDRFIIGGITYYIEDVDARLFDTYVVYLKTAA